MLGNLFLELAECRGGGCDLTAEPLYPRRILGLGTPSCESILVKIAASLLFLCSPIVWLLRLIVDSNIAYRVFLELEFAITGFLAVTKRLRLGIQ